MVKKRKIRCPLCGFLDTIKKGKRDGYSRYFWLNGQKETCKRG